MGVHLHTILNLDWLNDLNYQYQCWWSFFSHDDEHFPLACLIFYCKKNKAAAFFTSTSLMWQWQLSSCKLDGPTLIIAHLQWLQSTSLNGFHWSSCWMSATWFTLRLASLHQVPNVSAKKNKKQKKTKTIFYSASHAKGKPFSNAAALASVACQKRYRHVNGP